MDEKLIKDWIKSAVDKGITNILALRGDPPEGSDKWDAKDLNFQYAVQQTTCLFLVIRHYWWPVFGEFCIRTRLQRRRRRRGVEKHIVHIHNIFDIPVRNILIKWRCSRKHGKHTSNITNIPSRNIRIKSSRSRPNTAPPPPPIASFAPKPIPLEGFSGLWGLSRKNKESLEELFSYKPPW